MPPQRRDSQITALSAFALVGQVGFTVAIGVVAGVLAGRYLDRWAGTGGLLLAGAILVGLFAGLYGAYCLLARELPWNR